MGAFGSSHWATPRFSFKSRAARYEPMRQRWGYWPVDMAVRDGEQMGVAEGGKVAPAHIVDEDQDDIGRLGGDEGCCDGSQQEKSTSHRGAFRNWLRLHDSEVFHD